MSRLSICLVLLGLVTLSSIHINALRNLLEEKTSGFGSGFGPLNPHREHEESHDDHHEDEKPFHGDDRQPHDHEPSHPEDPRRHAMEEGHQGDQKPGHGGEEHTPGHGGEGDTPVHGGEGHMPGHGGEGDRPGQGGEEHMPGHGGEGDRPGHMGGRGPSHRENAPLGSEKLVVIDGHGKHKPPHKGHPPLKGVVHLSESQTLSPQNGKCPCGCNGDPNKHMPCGCNGNKSDKSMSCGCAEKQDKPIA